MSTAAASTYQYRGESPRLLTAVDLRQQIEAWNRGGCIPAEAAPITRAILAYVRTLHPSADIRHEFLRIESSTRYSDLAKLRRAVDLLERAQSAAIPSLVWPSR